jgi:hypothetical protein
LDGLTHGHHGKKDEQELKNIDAQSVEGKFIEPRKMINGTF